MVRKSRKSMSTNVITKTLNEMIADLGTVDGICSSRLSKVVKNKTDAELKLMLEDSNSELNALIQSQKVNLESDVSGRKYLQLFSLIQPLLKPVDIIPTTPPPTTQSNKEKDNLEDIMSQLQSPENSELMNLANSLMKDLNLEEKLKNYRTTSGVRNYIVSIHEIKYN